MNFLKKKGAICINVCLLLLARNRAASSHIHGLFLGWKIGEAGQCRCCLLSPLKVQTGKGLAG